MLHPSTVPAATRGLALIDPAKQGSPAAVRDNTDGLVDSLFGVELSGSAGGVMGDRFWRYLVIGARPGHRPEMPEAVAPAAYGLGR